MMNLIIKFPTRQRKEKFFQVLNKYYDLLNDLDNTRFVITCDTDDQTMNNPEVIKRFKDYRNLEVFYGNSKTKIQAVNADVPSNGWDILLLASDDMIPMIKGYDQIIRNAMSDNFPDTDGVLWFYDSHRKDLNTLIIIGFKYYQRFGYLYYPGYVTWYADNEFTNVASKLGKQVYFEQVIIEHQHYIWMRRRPDNLAIKENMTKDKKADEILYDSRKNPAINYKLSILICTLVGRDDKLKRLLNILEPQLTSEIEVLTCKDNKQFTIGAKRNSLVNESKGKYVCFIDDDDRVSQNYISLIMEGINKDVDCCSLTGIITINGRNPRTFIHSLQYKSYYERNKIYYRPPTHLNCIRSGIVRQFPFPEIDWAEDSAQAMAMSNAGVIKTEHYIKNVLYFYDYLDTKHRNK